MYAFWECPLEILLYIEKYFGNIIEKYFGFFFEKSGQLKSDLQESQNPI